MEMQQSVEDYVEILERFNEKIEFLSDQYPEFVNLDKLEITIHFSDKEIERHGPEPRLIPAVLLILRFFLMSEATSLCRMKKMYKKMPVSEEVKNEFYGIRDKINSFLNASSGVKIYFKEDGKVGYLGFCDPEKGGNSRREILNLFRYGHYEHMNDKEKVKQMNAIRNVSLNFEIVEQLQLIRILANLIQYISGIKQTNDKAIFELKNGI